MLKINSLKDKYEIIFFILVYLIGLNIFTDYGLSIDDEVYRSNGVFYKEFIIKYLGIIFSFNFDELNILKNEIIENPLKDHPVIFETLLAFLVDIFGIKDISQIYNISHLLNFTIYTLGLLAIYNLFIFRFKYKYVSIISISIFFLSPRFFAESFYNSRDIFFFSLFAFYLLSVKKILQDNSIRNKILLSLTSALLINAKILGIIPVGIFIFMYSINNFEKNNKYIDSIKEILILITFILIFIILLWPYLWLNPLNNFIDGYLDIIKAHNESKVITLFLGEHLTSTNTPWYYRILWFYITTPIIVCLMFSLGFALILKSFVLKVIKLDKGNSKLWSTNNEFLDFYLLICLVLIIFLTVKFNTSQFNGWRHLYFLYLPIVYFSTYSYINFFLNNSFFKKMINIFLLINILYLSFWIIKNHPHQNNFFNIFQSYSKKQNFDLDYWGLSNYYALKKILDIDKRDKISVSSVSFTDLNVSLLKFRPDKRKKIEVIYNYEKADYLINNYMKRPRQNFIIDDEKYTKIYQLYIDKNLVNSLFKKK